MLQNRAETALGSLGCETEPARLAWEGSCYLQPGSFCYFRGISVIWLSAFIAMGSIAVGQIPSLGHEAAGMEPCSGQSGARGASAGFGNEDGAEPLSFSTSPAARGCWGSSGGELLEESGFWGAPGAGRNGEDSMAPGLWWISGFCWGSGVM